mmetsp:Transcript_14526/g.17437  ORF Transcript_14526/g.17437 Transcript_14526/m.17437 type:complete len:103 (-) Transcript_14526:174-482(-)
MEGGDKIEEEAHAGEGGHQKEKQLGVGMVAAEDSVGDEESHNNNNNNNKRVASYILSERSAELCKATILIHDEEEGHVEEEEINWGTTATHPMRTVVTKGEV